MPVTLSDPVLFQLFYFLVDVCVKKVVWFVMCVLMLQVLVNQLNPKINYSFIPHIKQRLWFSTDSKLLIEYCSFYSLKIWMAGSNKYVELALQETPKPLKIVQGK